MKKIGLIALFFCLHLLLSAQQKALTSSEILHGIQKLKTVGNVMYVAAHPDDENTLLIAWLSKEKKLRTAYFALTRGDGGQNLIGNEQGEYVGLIRTHELLEARKIDEANNIFQELLILAFRKKRKRLYLPGGKTKFLAIWCFKSVDSNPM
jgi:hypothetical protein